MEARMTSSTVKDHRSGVGSCSSSWIRLRGGLDAFLEGGLADGGQRRVDIAREGDIVKPDDRQVLGDAQPAFLGGLQRADGHHVVGQEDGGRRSLRRWSSCRVKLWPVSTRGGIHDHGPAWDLPGRLYFFSTVR